MPRSPFRFGCFVAVLGWLLLAAGALASNPRISQSIDRHWTFNYFPAQNADSLGCEAPEFDDSSWPAVAVPHTWSTYETTGELHPFIRDASERNSTYWWFGWGWYRKHFEIDRSQAGRKVFVEFDGVQKYCKIWLNGYYLGDHKGGYASFSVDLTDHVRFGADNVLAVAVNNRQDDPFHIPPMTGGDWDVYGGIYRNARLVITDRLHIPFQGSDRQEGGTFITTPKVSPAEAELSVKTWVRNDYARPKVCELSTVIVDAGGNVALTLASTRVIPPGKLVEIDQTGTLAKPDLWSPDSPYLYTAHSEVRTGGKMTDRFDSPFGVRSIHWVFGDTPEDNTLLVNGQPVDLQGFCRAEEYPWLGGALPGWIERMDLQDMKVNLGCNFFRSDHYTANRSVYDYCDRHGLLAVEDVPNTKDEDFSRAVQEQQVREMIRRDRNDPAIFAWVMGDETNRAADSKWAHEEDATRYIHARDCPGAAQGDFISLPSKDLRLGRLMSCTIRGWYGPEEFAFEPKNHQSTSNEERQHQSYLESSVHIGTKNMAVWLYADFSCWHAVYQNEPVLYINPKGWVDLYRFPKFAYYLWQANRIAKPMVFVHPEYWRSQYLGERRDFIVDSNCDSVELDVNGRSVGTAYPSPRNLHVVTFRQMLVERGTLTAIGRKGGHTVVDRLPMAGAPARIVLTTEHGSLEAARNTVAVIDADIVDRQGNPIYGATNTVHWSVEGPATLVGPAVYESDVHRNMAAEGTMYIDMPVANVIRSTGVPGRVVVRVQAAGLRYGEVALDLRPAAAPVPGPIRQPSVPAGHRVPVKRDFVLSAEPMVPEEIAAPSIPLPPAAAAHEREAERVRDWIRGANPAAKAATPEFGALVEVLTHEWELSGDLPAADVAFNIGSYNRCRQIARCIAAAPLPDGFKAQLRRYYVDRIIRQADVVPFSSVRSWIAAIPSGTRLVVVPRAGEASVLVAQFYPAFGKADADAREAAMRRLRRINPAIVRSQWIAGDRKTKDQKRIVTYAVGAGQAVLLPPLQWLMPSST